MFHQRMVVYRVSRRHSAAIRHALWCSSQTSIVQYSILLRMDYHIDWVNIRSLFSINFDVHIVFIHDFGNILTKYGNYALMHCGWTTFQMIPSPSHDTNGKWNSQWTRIWDDWALWQHWMPPHPMDTNPLDCVDVEEDTAICSLKVDWSSLYMYE